MACLKITYPLVLGVFLLASGSHCLTSELVVAPYINATANAARGPGAGPPESGCHIESATQNYQLLPALTQTILHVRLVTTDEGTLQFPTGPVPPELTANGTWYNNSQATRPTFLSNADQSPFSQKGTAVFEFNPTAAEINKTARILVSAIHPQTPIPGRPTPPNVPCFILLDLRVVAPPPPSPVPLPVTDGPLPAPGADIVDIPVNEQCGGLNKCPLCPPGANGELNCNEDDITTVTACDAPWPNVRCAVAGSTCVGHVNPDIQKHDIYWWGCTDPTKG